MPEEIVKIGKKSIGDYESAIIYAIQNFDECILRALGNRVGKAEKLEKYAKSFDGLKVAKKEPISVNGTPGVRIKIEVVKDG